MKKYILNHVTIISTIIFLFAFSPNLFSQFDNIGTDCGTSDESEGFYPNIPVKTPGASEFFRCLVIYITFPDDDDNGYLYTIWEKPILTPNSKPNNPYSGSQRAFN